jgi:hypothetical protein
MTDEEPTYCIKRFHRPGVEKEDYVVLEGLTLAEAKAYCEDPETATDDYFDGFMKE